MEEVSAQKGNLLNLTKDKLKTYFNKKRYNMEDQAVTIKNFYSELKYALGLIVETRDIMNFINHLEELKTISEIEKDIRV